jgi:hypothetical protein
VAQKAADLGSIMVRPGQARGLRPEAVAGGEVRPAEPPSATTNDAQADHVEQGAGALAGQGGPAVVVVQPTIAALPARPKKEEMTTLSVRIPVEIAAALHWLSQDASLAKQDFVASVLDAGLTAHFNDWRKQLDESYPRWRALIQK